jgi:arylsulfatase A-like enzyme
MRGDISYRSNISYSYQKYISIQCCRICKLILLGVVVLMPSCTQHNGQLEEVDQPNILFIAVDDLNDWTGVLNGHPQVRTPNIDRLASRGVLFTNAHSPAPACNPSRVAVLTGLLPSTSGVYFNNQRWRQFLPDAETLPQYFMKNGYTALGAGKIFHSSFADPASWDKYFPSKRKTSPDDPFPKNIPLNGISSTRNFDWGPIDVEDREMGDYKLASWVIEQLHSTHKKPFFLAAGFYRPHLPWYVPKTYFDHYPLDSIQLPIVLANDLDDIPPAGISMANPMEHHKKVIAHDQWKKAVQGYLAAIEFADAQVGRVIDALDQSAYKDNTIIVLWSDHGWHLGEKSHWRKFALWERATRVTFMIFDPRDTKAGSRLSQPVNLLSIYPTLVELAGLPSKKAWMELAWDLLLKIPNRPGTTPL